MFILTNFETAAAIPMFIALVTAILKSNFNNEYL